MVLEAQTLRKIALYGGNLSDGKTRMVELGSCMIKTTSKKREIKVIIIEDYKQLELYSTLDVNNH